MAEIYNSATIILCGGPINYSDLPIGTNLSNAMIPINGKPVVGWIVDDLLSKGISSVTIVLRSENKRLKTFVERSYGGRMQINLALLDCDGTIVESLRAGLDANPEARNVRIILGDTLIKDIYESGDDFVYISAVDDSRRWCLAVIGKDNLIVDYIDKQDVTNTPFMALAGYYHLQDADLLRRSIENTIALGQAELSHVLRKYGAERPILARTATEWYDFGHLDNVIEARRRLLRPRHFNTLTINPILNTITKISDNDEKLQAELDWYLQIPDELKVLTPRILRHEVVGGKLQIVQEYYGYPSLAELYVYGELHADAWISILRHVLRIHQQFRAYPGQLSKGALKRLYYDKLLIRLEKLCNQESAWRAILKQPTIKYNNRILRNIPQLIQDVEVCIDKIIGGSSTCIVHGDYCFSNILFDINNRIVRLIDPRGSFGEKGINGDPRYDIAKLRHSVCGLYDFYTSDMFQIRTSGTEFEGEIYANGTVGVVGEAFDEMIQEMGYSLEEIKLIEGLLFVSMLPLHGDYPLRQQMMFARGISLLNDVC